MRDPYPFHRLDLTKTEAYRISHPRIQRQARRASRLDRSGPVIFTVLATLVFGILIYFGGCVEGWW